VQDEVHRACGLFDYGTTLRDLPWHGYVEPGSNLIYPLVITGPLAQAKLRDPAQEAALPARQHQRQVAVVLQSRR
jgi:hypothetical protein